MAITGEHCGREFAIVIAPGTTWQERKESILSGLEGLKGITLESIELLRSAVASSPHKTIIRGYVRSGRQENFENLSQFVARLNGREDGQVCVLYRTERNTIKTQRNPRKTREFGIPAVARIPCYILFMVETFYRIFGECARAVLLPFNILFLS